MAKRYGRQTPTSSHVLPYNKTLGQEAKEIFEKSGRKMIPWQEALLTDIMAVDEDGLWTHTKCGYTVGRRNGKSVSVSARIMWSLEHGEKVIYTAHRTKSSHATWEDIKMMLLESGLQEKTDFVSIRADGREEIRMVHTKGYVTFRTRSTLGGLGEGYDLLVIDEAQEYLESQESTLKYLVTASKNGQTIMLGTPPTAQSSGTVFPDFREKVMEDAVKRALWYEWAVPEMSDVRDVDLWYETNPSLGYHLTERAIEDEIGKDEIDFNIQRLGLWIKYNQKSAIDPRDWEDLMEDELPELEGMLCAGIKYGKDGRNAALSIAVKTEDGRILVEAIDCRPVSEGTFWMIDFLREADISFLAIDGNQAKSTLAEDMKDVELKLKPTFLNLQQIKDAAAVFEQAIYRRTMCHMGQPSLKEIAGHCEKRHIGSDGGFGYRSQREDLDICLLDSAMLAHWARLKAKPKKKARVSY